MLLPVGRPASGHLRAPEQWAPARPAEAAGLRGKLLPTIQEGPPMEQWPGRKAGGLTAGDASTSWDHERGMLPAQDEGGRAAQPLLSKEASSASCKVK
eukprot:scaffold893_cov336-Prasinococcus_capsulatus_cf.AAC.4